METRFYRSPLFILQLLNAAFILAVTRSASFVAIVALSAVLYMIMINIGHERRLQCQRQVYSRIRNGLARALNLRKLQEIEADGWDQMDGARAFSSLVAKFGIPLFFAFLWEGRYFACANILANAMHIHFAASSGSQEMLMFTGRFNVVLQLGMIASLGTLFAADGFRRTLITRTIVSLCYIESIHELFVQIVIFPTVFLIYRFGMDQNILFLPSWQFFLIVIPIEIFGLRLWILQKFRRTKHLSSKSFVAGAVVLVPSIIALSSFSIASQSRMVNGSDLSMEIAVKNTDGTGPSRALVVFPLVGFLATATKALWADWLEFLVQPTFTPKKGVTQVLNLTPISGAWICTLLTLIFYQDLWGYAILGFLLFWKAKQNADEEVERTVFYLFETCLLFLAKPSLVHGSLNMLLSCSRLWLCFENRRISEMITEATFMASVHCLFSCSPWKKFVILIWLCGSLVTVAMRMASENSRSFVKSVRNADSFLDHAVKQKFSALGSAMQHVTEAHEGKMDPASLHLLSSAILECNLGLAACHLSSSALKYEAGTFSPSPGSIFSVVHLLREWSDNGDLNAKINVEGDETIEAQLDGDLFRSLMIDLARHNALTAHESKNSVPQNETRIVVDKEGDSIFIRLLSNTEHGRGKKQLLLRSIRESVARALGGRLGEDGSSLYFPARPSNTSSLSTSLVVAAVDSAKSLSTGVESLRRSRGDSDDVKSASERSCRDSFGSAHSLPPMPETVPALVRRTTPPQTTRRLTGGESRMASRKTSSSSSLDTVGGKSISPCIGYRILQAEGKLMGPVLPKGLSFAVLDDNNLVRKSLEFIFRMHLNADMIHTFVMGGTMEEADDFPEKIISRNVDIAIFDENLEYGEETLKGSSIATRAMSLGFKGCLVLHSANTSLAENLEPCFHGFVEKTSSKETFLRCLAQAYQRYKESRNMY